VHAQPRDRLEDVESKSDKVLSNVWVKSENFEIKIKKQRKNRRRRRN